MVYYFTSGNVRMLRNILIDYGSAKEISPHEYMKTYIDKCPEDTDDNKLAWIAETFLGIQKHGKFLRDIASHLSEELEEEDQDNFMILFYAVTFQVNSKDVQLMYKCLFNLSKPLLNTFTKFLSTNEVLTFISQIAEVNYDTGFITNKIINPLFTWQPYISEMAHNYAEHVKKIEIRRIKAPTVPIQPNVLNRGAKEVHQTAGPVSHPSVVTPPNSVQVKRMLTKSVIDQRLKQSYEKNKQRAIHLLNEAKNKELNFSKIKPDGYTKKNTSVKDELDYNSKILPKYQRNKLVTKHVPQPVKETAATVKRMGKIIQQAEQEEMQWLTNVINCKNTFKIEELLEFDRQERERERLLDIEKKHLMGQISYEEALLAKKKQIEENKRRYEEFLKEKETWNDAIENWRRIEMEKNRKQIEKLCLIELNVLEAKNGVCTKNKETANRVKKETQVLLEKAIKAKQEELDYRMKIIKEFKILSIIAKKARIPKIIDLTETSGMGLLCEMSIAELQERMNAMKIGFHEELERKKRIIKEEKTAAKQQLEETKNSIKSYMIEKETLRKQNKVSKSRMKHPSKEIEDLKKILEEKRKLRISLTN